MLTPVVMVLEGFVVGAASMTNTKNGDYVLAIVNPIYGAIISDSNSPKIYIAGEFLTSNRPRIAS
jgi:hypothetical protein